MNLTITLIEGYTNIIALLIILIVLFFIWRKLYDIARGRNIYDDLYLFNNRLLEMVKLNIPLHSALEEIAIDAFSPVSYRFSSIRKPILRASRRVAQGIGLGNALEYERKTFPAFYAEMIEIGENEGLLAEMLTVLNSFLNSKKKHTATGTQIFLYFLVISFILSSIGTFLKSYIMPTYKEIINSFTSENLFFIDLLEVYSTYVPKIFAVILFLIIGYFFLKRTKEIRRLFDRIEVKIPLLKTLIREHETMIFCQMMGNLLEGCIPVDNSLIIASGALTNSVYAQGVKNSANVVEPTLAKAVARCGLFDETFMFMLSLGESSGNLPQMFKEMGSIYMEKYEVLKKQTLYYLEIFTVTMLGFGAALVCFMALTPLAVMMESIVNSIIMY